MKVRPVKQYDPPAYPTLEEYRKTQTAHVLRRGGAALLAAAMTAGASGCIAEADWETSFAGLVPVSDSQSTAASDESECVVLAGDIPMPGDAFTSDTGTTRTVLYPGEVPVATTTTSSASRRSTSPDTTDTTTQGTPSVTTEDTGTGTEKRNPRLTTAGTSLAPDAEAQRETESYNDITTEPSTTAPTETENGKVAVGGATTRIE